MITFKRFLSELTIKGAERYSFKDVPSFLNAYKHKIKKAVRVGTSFPNIMLAAIENHGEYIVFIIDQELGEDEPIGFVEFVHPSPVGRNYLLADNVRTPHTGILHEYAGKGYMSAVYSWFLDAGNNLTTGHEQTRSGNALWKKLSARYKVIFLNRNGLEIKHPTQEEAASNSTRMVLLGKGQTIKDIFKKN